MKGQFKDTKASNPTYRDNWDRIFRKKGKVIPFRFPQIIFDPINYGVVAFKSK